MASPIPGRRRAAGLAGFAGLVLTVGLTLTGCDPSAADAKPTSSPTSSQTVAAVPSAASPTVPAPPAVTPSAPPTAAAPPPSAPPAVHPQTPAAKPQPKVTTAQPPTDPQHTQAAGGSECEIRSNAGNCYAAGQFCRNDDLGRSTHDAGGRVIYCRMVSGKPHWQA